MKIGIAGLPRTGKTTVFRLLTGEHAHVAKGTEPSVGTAKLVEPRLDRLAEIFHPKKITAPTAECLDFPGLAPAAKRGEPEGPALASLRQVDLILHVIRDFEDARVPHEQGSVDPLRDIGLLDTLFLVADLDVVDKRIQRITEDARKGRKAEGHDELALFERCREWLAQERNLREMALAPGEEKDLRGYAFLTLKPVLLLVNMGEEKVGKADPAWQRVQEMAARPRTGCIRLPAKTEWELGQLPREDAREFAKALGIETLESPAILRRCLDLLDLITFFTVVGDELRAWVIPRGATALEAAGAIHTDMAKGFIKAEVIAFRDLDAAGSIAAARKQGLVRLEGKSYAVQDGDILTVRFSR